MLNLTLNDPTMLNLTLTEPHDFYEDINFVRDSKHEYIQQ